MQTELAERQLQLRAFGHGGRRRELFALPLREHDEVVEVRVVLAHEVETAAGLLLELDEAQRARPDQERSDLGRDLDAIRLVP